MVVVNTREFVEISSAAIPRSLPAFTLIDSVEPTATSFAMTVASSVTMPTLTADVMSISPRKLSPVEKLTSTVPHLVNVWLRGGTDRSLKPTT